MADQTRADQTRAAYRVLRDIARRLATTIRERRQVEWVSHEDFVRELKEAGINENSRTVVGKVLRPLQDACLRADLPDLSALVVRKQKGDIGSLLEPAQTWWEPYMQRGDCRQQDVQFWFSEFKRARDFDWPERAPF